MLIAYQCLESKGMLSHDLNPLVQLCVMYPAASFGSIVPDDDLASIPEKTPFNLVVGKLIHMTGAKHRSWQTHCIVIAGSICMLGIYLVGALGWTGLNTMDRTILRLIIMGFSVGLASHLIMDMLTTQGVHLVPDFKIKFVPSSTAFATGGRWEDFVRIVLYISIACLVFAMVYQGVTGHSVTTLLNEVMRNVKK